MSVTLKVGGKIYSGWTSVNIRRSLFCASGSFDLSICDQDGTEDSSLSIKPGEACSVMIGNETVITGYIDHISRSVNSHETQTTIGGRDKMMDVVDSSAIMKEKSWKNTELFPLVSSALSKFNIKPILHANGKHILPYHQLNEGSETVWEFIERAARICCLICHSDGLGNLIITTPSRNAKKPRPRLSQSENLISALVNIDYSGRFSDYTVESTPYQGDGEDDTIVIPLRTKPIKDNEVKRHRPMLIVAESLATPALLIARGEWERDVRRGRSVKVNAEVLGWEINNKLWNINEWVTLSCPLIGINNEDFLITEVSFQLGVNEGQKTTLELQPASAFLSDPTLRARQYEKLRGDNPSD